MPRNKYAEDSDSPAPDCSDDDSDFDEDDDPDNLEVPGGGKTLAAAAGLPEKPKPATSAMNMPTIRIANSSNSGLGNMNLGGINRTLKIPGLVTKSNTTPGFEMIKLNPANSANPSSAMASNSFPLMSGGGPVSGAAHAPLHPGPTSFNSTSLLAQMEMAGMNLNSSPFLLQNLSQILAGGANNPMNMNNIMGSNMGGPMGWQAGLQNPKLWAEQKMATEEDEVDDEEMGVAETYADYMPPKLKLGKKHPDPVVETASLSSVQPPDVWYRTILPEETINTGKLSALQLEAVVYAAQAHSHHLPDKSRAGFLIGDGAGVGKGRTIAGIIFENYLRGRKRAIWISVSNDLKYDAERDLRDIGAKIDVHPLNKFKYAKISSPVNGNIKKGVIFSTYSALIGESYSTTNNKYRTRLKQLLQWCGDDFDGCIVFDECHKAKNLCPVGSSKPTKTGLTAVELQNRLPNARVVYASATGASEPRNMAYMVRLGIWGEGTPFPYFLDFITAVEKRGVGAMEIVAMDMKLRGMYIARQLSFHGVSFKIDEVALNKDFKKTYDEAVALWVQAMQKFTEAAELIDAENRMKKTMWGQFWSAHQRFFKYLCIASKVNHAVVVAREAVKCGKCVVIGLQSTGEAKTLEQLERDEGELTDFVSTAKGVIQTLVEKHFPAPDRNRINRVLGIGGPKTTESNNGNSKNGDSSGNSTGKRKFQPSQRTTARAIKKPRRYSSSDNSSPPNSPPAVINSDSDDEDFSADEPEMNDSGSDRSSDFNPFKGSDSDDDPWVGRKKKQQVKKTKKPNVVKKKSTTTQEKIQEHIEKKTSDSVLSANFNTNPNRITVSTPYGSVTGTPIGSNGIYLGPPKNQPPPKDAIEKACTMKEKLLEAIEKLGDRLPANTLDQLIDELGGPENVAEMTGRKGRVVQTEEGQILYESRSEAEVPLETLNLTEKQRFMDGDKDVAIISEAASSGISLQSDRRALNQRRRVHITLELPWSADRAIQQFGRTHRSNQVNAPEYIFLISDLAGERRFASTVAKRLESLGALTHGDRRATETRDFSQFNIDNKYGRTALEATMKTIMKYESPIVPPPQDYEGDFFQDVASALVGVGLIINSETTPGVLSLDKDYNNISKFLNRILGMPVELQNRLFTYFMDTLQEIIAQARRTGRFDLGILDLGAAGESVTRVKRVKFLRKHATGVAPIELHTVYVERGMSWQEAMEKWSTLTGSGEGFYMSQQVRNNKQTAILAISLEPLKKKGEKVSKKNQMYQIYRPNTGLQIRNESLAEIEKKYRKASSTEAEEPWTNQYESSITVCNHAYWKSNCRNVTMGQECEIGLRRRSYHVLSGSVLSVWARVEEVLTSKSSLNKMQVIRLKTVDGLKIVGTLIPKNCVDLLKKTLSSDAEKVDEETYENPIIKIEIKT